MNDEASIRVRTEVREKKIRDVLSRRQPTLTIVLENIHDPHNVSAVFRTCDSVGVEEVQLLYYGNQSFPELGEKSSASARKWVDRRQFSSVSECYTSLRERGFTIVATSLSEESRNIYGTDFTGKTAIVFGNEHTGVSKEAAEFADGNITIPQSGMIQSLNISVACAVVLYEALRQRQAAGMYDSLQYSAEEYNDKIRQWLTR